MHIRDNGTLITEPNHELLGPRTMTDVMVEMGVENPYCDGQNPVHFLRELGQEKRSAVVNYAGELCARCEVIDCPIKQGVVDLPTLLRSEIDLSEQDRALAS